MASAASRSALSADSYIGSLISLTSKYEIRYEGVLYTINTEESSIGLRNVRSFGTEGRKKDGPQIPPRDQIYEYILFRGSDIKDLQVKPSPPTQPSPPMHNDPAIIQSHYPPPTSASTSMPSSGSGYVPDVLSQNGQSGMPRAAFQGGLPLYQPSGSLDLWSSTPAPPSENGSGLGMPIYWQGFYPPGGLSHLQQPSLLRPSGLQTPLVQQPLQYPGTSVSLPSISSSLSATDASLPSGLSNLPGENSLLSTAVPKLPSSLFPPSVLSSAVLPSIAIPFPPTNLAFENPQALSSSSSYAPFQPVTVATSLPFTSSMSKTGIDLVAESAPVYGSSVSYLATSNPLSSTPAGLSSSTQGEILASSLVTPAQLLQSGSPSVPLPQASQTSFDQPQKSLKAVVVSEEDLTDPKKGVIETNEPILPLPRNQKANDTFVHAYNHHRHRGRGRGRGSELARSATSFNEDFDFNAMNEKFNKEEVWGHLGKSNGSARERDKDLTNFYAVDENFDEDIPESSQADAKAKPVYVKDDFFDTLSCQSLAHAQRTARTRFFEQRRIDTETFGDVRRDHQRGRGGRGFYGGWSRGSFNARGYGYMGRGRGYSANNYRV